MLGELPEDLQAGWTDLFRVADVAADEIGGPQEWRPDVNGLDKVQDLMSREGGIDPSKRSLVAPLIAEASRLFSESSRLVAVDTAYYYEKVVDMQDILRRLTQPKAA